jgi:hypothetical protein
VGKTTISQTIPLQIIASQTTILQTIPSQTIL